MSGWVIRAICAQTERYRVMSDMGGAAQDQSIWEVASTHLMDAQIPSPDATIIT
jgi:hypothetical protein